MTRWLYLGGSLFAGLLVLAACAAPKTPQPALPTPTTLLATVTQTAQASIGLSQLTPLPTFVPTETPTNTPTLRRSKRTPTPTTPTFTSAPLTFARVTTSQPITLTSIQMIDSHIGWGWADFPSEYFYVHLLRTEDGGSTWRDVSPPLGGGYGLAVLDANTAWVNQDDFRGLPWGYLPCRDDNTCPNWTDPVIARVWHTQDGGRNWNPSHPLDLTPSYNNDAPAAYSSGILNFVDSQTGWLLIDINQAMMQTFTELFKTMDGGLHWQRVPPSPAQGVISCAGQFVFQDVQRGWLTAACGLTEEWNGLYRTNDGGQTWQEQPLPPPTELQDFNNIIKNDQWDCTFYNLHFWAPQSLSLLVHCASRDQEGLVDNHQAYTYLYTTADNGQTWQSRPLDLDFGGLYFLNSRVAFALGPGTEEVDQRYILYKTRDQGQSWIAIKTVIWQAQLDFINENEGWALTWGEAKALLHTTDGGRTWAQLQPQLVP